MWQTIDDSLIFFFQAEDGIRDLTVTGVQTCALPILRRGNYSRFHGGQNRTLPYLPGVPERGPPCSFRGQNGRSPCLLRSCSGCAQACSPSAQVKAAATQAGGRNWNWGKENLLPTTER